MQEKLSIFLSQCCQQQQSEDSTITEEVIHRKVPYIQAKKAKKQTTGITKNVQAFFLESISKKKPTIWAILHKHIFEQSNKQLRQKLDKTFQDMKQNDQILMRHPIFSQCSQIIKLQQQHSVKIIVDQSIFKEAMDTLHECPNIQSFYLVSPQSFMIAQNAFDYSKMRQIHSNYDQIIKLIINEGHKIAVLIKKQDISKAQKGFRYQVMFPNFLRINKHEKSIMRQYRINIYALTTLSQDQKILSKKKFCQFALKIYQEQKKKIADIQNYGIFNHQDEWILKQYTKDTYFYRVINSTLRMAYNTQEFFVIGQPFGRLFNAIKKMYHQKQIKQFQLQQVQQKKVYRKVQLSNQESQYLRNNLGSYIEILGFISSSKSQQVALCFGDDKEKKQAKVQIIEFILRQPFKNMSEKYYQLDYGYVDLSERELTVHPQQEQVLINAMNIFKIKEIKSKVKYGREYQYIVLQYGAIFDLLGKNSQQMTVVQRQTLADYLILQQLALEVNNIGQAYLKNNKWKQAFNYFKAIADKQNDFQKKTEANLKIAQALQSGYKVDDALKIYQQGLQTLLKQNQRLSQKKKTQVSLSQNQVKTNKFVEQKVAQIQAKLIATYVAVDDFERAEEISNKLAEQIARTSPQINSVQKLKKMAQAKESIIYAKSMQQQIFQQRRMIEQANKIYQKVQNSSQLSLEDQRKVLLKRSELFQRYINSQFKNPSNQKETKVKQLLNSFEKVSQKLQKHIVSGTYEHSVLKRRQLQMKAQDLILQLKRGQSKSIKSTANSLNSIKSQAIENLKVISKQVGEVDEQFIKGYSLVSTIVSSQSIPTEAGYEQSVKFQQKASRNSLILYSKNDYRSVQSLNSLALLHSKYSNHEQGIRILQQATKMNVNKRGAIHTSIAKTYYNIGCLYYQKGELQKAMNAFDQSLDIFEKSLKQKRFKESVFRYKVNLERGMVMIDRFDPRAETLLTDYRQYTKRYEQRHQSTPQVGKSYNILGLYYLKYKKTELSIKNFLKAEEQFIKYGGQKYIELGRIKCNLAICKAVLHTSKIVENENTLIQKAQNIFKFNIPQNYDIHPFRAKSYWYHGQISWIRQQYAQAIEYYSKSIEITKKYEWYCKLNQFVCRFKIAQCMRQIYKNKKTKILTELEKYLCDLMQDIQRDLSETQGYNKNDKKTKVKSVDNRKYGILKRIYELLDVDEATKIE